MNFKTGDVVRHTAGGPKMTVSHVYDKFIFVMWFDTLNHLQRAQFEADVLEVIT